MELGNWSLMRKVRDAQRQRFKQKETRKWTECLDKFMSKPIPSHRNCRQKGICDLKLYSVYNLNKHFNTPLPFGVYLIRL